MIEHYSNGRRCPPGNLQIGSDEKAASGLLSCFWEVRNGNG